MLREYRRQWFAPSLMVCNTQHKTKKISKQGAREEMISDNMHHLGGGVECCGVWQLGEAELERLGMGDVHIWYNIAVLVAFIVAYRLLAYIGIHFLYKEKK